MPISTDHKSMVANLRKQYCKGAKLDAKMEFADGSTMMVCTRAKSIFHATMRKHKWDDTKPRPKATSETVEWFIKTKGLKK